MAKILVIEDETILRGEVAEWLTLEGHEALVADDGVRGVAAVYRQQPDLIICDITMPYLDGYGVLLEIHANPLMADTPFIFVTARASHDDVRRGMELGADDYITKPFSRMELLNAVQSRLEKRELQRQNRQAEVAVWREAFEQEREQRLLKAKLVAMFSHDFRNPLTGILVSSNLLRDYMEQLDEAGRKSHFNHIDASVRQLLNMLDDMLFVSQMETDRLQFEPEAVNVTAFLRHMVDEFQAIHRQTCQVHFESHMAVPVMADVRLLRQIATNLISNAIKYSPQGSEVRIMAELKPDGYWTLTVQDHGIGIPEADLPGLFEAFHRAANVGDIAGTGLGLAIVKQAAEMHGGAVHLDSQVGIGTQVTVVLPVG